MAAAAGTLPTTTTSAVLRDPARLDALRSTGLLEPGPDEALDRLSRLAVRALGAPVAFVTLVGAERPVFKSVAGPPELSAVRETPLAHSLCRQAVATGEAFVIHDARGHADVRHTPAVVDLGLAAYLGIPLVTRQGHAVGAFCAADRGPRTWSDSDLELMRDLAASAVSKIELRRATALAQLGERRLVQAQALAGIGSWEWDVLSGRVSWSDQVYSIIGVHPSAGPYDHDAFIEHVHPGDRERVRRAIDAALAGERAWYEYECRLRRPDGETRAISVRADIEYAADGTPFRSTGIVRDVTAERRTTDELGAAARRLEEAQGLAQMGSWEWDAHTGNTSWSAQLYRIFGIDPADGAPSHIQFLGRVHPDDRDRVDRITIGAHTDGDERYEFECRILRTDGELRWVRARGEILHDERGRLVRSSGVAQDITERRTVASRLAEAESLGRMGSWEWDVEADRATWSAQLYRIFGLDRATFTPTRESAVSLAHPDDRERVAAALDAAIAGAPLDITTRARRRDGEIRWIRVRAEAPRNAAGAVVRLTGTMQDISEQRRAESLLHEAEDRFGAAFDATSLGMALLDVDVRRFLRVNRALCVGLEREEADVLAMNPLELLPTGDRALDESTFDELLEGTRRNVEFEHRYLLRSGDVRISLVHITLVRDGGGEPLYFVLQARDMTDQRRAEEGLRYHALHHALTGLPNRTLFLDRLRHALRQADRRGSTVGVIALDLDRFRAVNERFGLEGGDELLRVVGPRLVRALRDSDTVAHLGEDLFAAICEDLTDVHEALELAARLGRAVAAPIDIGGESTRVTASMGIALAANGDEHSEDLVRDAESAAVRARERGGGAWEVFDPALRARLVDRLQLEHELRRGIDRGELRVHYQPVLRRDGHQLVGHEALVRWEHPERGLLLPGVFLAVAEETGLDVPLGTFVLREACRQGVAWSDDDPSWKAAGVGVNVSARQLDQPGFVDEVAAVLAETGIRPAQLRLELTETDLMRSADPVGIIERLKELGVRVILDDFGTGWSSLSHLRRFPVDGLKIDRSFVADVDTDRRSAQIVEAIVAMARALDLTVVAEGVENPRQLARVAELGCDMVQGFLLGRPAAPEALRRDWSLADR